MSGTDQPPSATDSPQPRRVLPRALAALASLVVPVALVASMDVGPLASAATAEPSPGWLARAPHQVRTDAAARAILVDLERMAAVVAPPPTTPPTTAPPSPPVTEAPVAVASGSGAGDPGDPASWDRLAICESGGNWAINTGNGYYGGIQFSMASWQAVGGVGRPDQASRETQIAMGQRLWNQGGWGHWPACSRRLGFR